ANGSAASSPLETGGFKVQKNRSLFFWVAVPSGARVSRAGDVVSTLRTFENFCVTAQRKKIVSARRRNQHARRVRYPELCGQARERTAICLLSLVATSLCYAQYASPTPESQPIHVIATRTDIPLDPSPASLPFLPSHDIT